MSKESIDVMVDRIKAYLDDGWSINVAKKKALGSESSIKYRYVIVSEQYRDMLNEYLKRTKTNFKYEIVGNKLQCQPGRRRV